MQKSGATQVKLGTAFRLLWDHVGRKEHLRMAIIVLLILENLLPCPFKGGVPCLAISLLP